MHRFLTESFGGYTATSGNLFGFWEDDSGKDQYGEHRAFTVGLLEDSRLGELKQFLGNLAQRMGEQSLYVEVGGDALLVYST